jgi:uncharacterized protein (DUF362 family)
VEINSAFTVDLVVADALKMNTGYGTDATDEVSPGVIIAGGNAVACDAAAVAVMRRYGTVRVADRPVKTHDQFIHAQRIKLGSPNLEDINLMTSDLVGDEGFQALASYVKAELED